MQQSVNKQGRLLWRTPRWLSPTPEDRLPSAASQGDGKNVPAIITQNPPITKTLTQAVWSPLMQWCNPDTNPDAASSQFRYTLGLKKNVSFPGTEKTGLFLAWLLSFWIYSAEFRRGFTRSVLGFFSSQNHVIIQVKLKHKIIQTGPARFAKNDSDNG